MALSPGTNLGPYEIVELIGQGATGEVYRARDTRLGRDVAIKILTGSSSAQSERFQEEARATSALNHPNIVSVYDVGIADGLPYIVVELLEGETLRQRLDSGPFPPRKAVACALQAARGLAAAHAAGIVHRDLKPENIFLTRDGRVKILDFGLAKSPLASFATATPGEPASGPTLTLSGALIGTIGYMALEMVRGLGADYRADVFSFDALLYEMLLRQAGVPGAVGGRDNECHPQERSAAREPARAHHLAGAGTHRHALLRGHTDSVYSVAFSPDGKTLASADGADALASVKQLVLNAVSSPLTRVMYARALDDFFGWWTGQGRPPFTRATVQAWRAALESKGLAPASVNQKLSAVRKLATEATYNGLLDSAAAQAIRDIRGAEQRGVRTGNWLTKRQAEALLAAPDATTNQGKRDRAILAVLVGCGLRRDEAVRLTFDHIQQRDDRWCVVDLVGKKGRYRTVPMPAWTKTAIDSWAAAAGFTAGPVFRGVNKGDVVIGDRLSTQGVLRAVTRYAEAIVPHDLRRTFAKLAFKGGAKLDQIQLSLGHASIQTTERYLGVQQDLTDAPCDYLHLKVE